MGGLIFPGFSQNFSASVFDADPWVAPLQEKDGLEHPPTGHGEAQESRSHGVPSSVTETGHKKSEDKIGWHPPHHQKKTSTTCPPQFHYPPLVLAQNKNPQQ